MGPRLLAGAVALAALGGCYGTDPTTPGGKSRPQLEVSFPASAPPRSVQTATVEITNPGPGDMNGLLVSFTLVGAPGREGLALPLVTAAPPGGDRSVVAVRPEPLAVSDDGVVFRFGPLPEGESRTIAFDLRIPGERGRAASSIVVSDAQEIDRASGRKIEVVIEG